MPPDDTTRWILIGAALAAAFYLIVLRPKMRKGRRSDPLDRPGELSRQRGIEREMSAILVELTDMTRQVSSQLDTRAAKLEVLIQQADQRIAMLQSLQGGERRNSDSFSRDNAATPHTGLPPLSWPNSPPSSPDNSRHSEVYALADQGNSASEIASRLGLPNGEIQLILALRSRTQ